LRRGLPFLSGIGRAFGLFVQFFSALPVFFPVFPVVILIIAFFEFWTFAFVSAELFPGHDFLFLVGFWPAVLAGWFSFQHPFSNLRARIVLK
jgi:hypothetical protein